MATVPPQEKAAKEILAILKQSNAKPGDIFQTSAVSKQFIDGGKGHAVDFTAGLGYAQRKRWIKYAGTVTRIEITDKGLNEI